MAGIRRLKRDWVRLVVASEIEKDSGHPTGPIDDGDGDERTYKSEISTFQDLESLTHYRSLNTAMWRYSHACYTHVYSDILLVFAMGS